MQLWMKFHHYSKKNLRINLSLSPLYVKQDHPFLQTNNVRTFSVVHDVHLNKLFLLIQTSVSENVKKNKKKVYSLAFLNLRKVELHNLIHDCVLTEKVELFDVDFHTKLFKFVVTYI